MVSTHAAKNLWKNERDANYTPNVPSIPYLTDAQRARLARIAMSRRLYEGDHYGVFVDDRKSRWPVPKVKVQDQIVEVYSPINLLKLLANKSAGLLFGGEPQIKTDGGEQENRLKALMERSQLQALLIECEIECGIAGETVLEACIYEDEVYLQTMPVEQIHPEGPLLPTRQYASYVYYAEQNRGTDKDPDWRLLEVRYKAGSIERAVYRMSPAREKLERLALSDWPEFQSDTPPDVVRTGISMNTIVWIPNLMLEREAVADFDGMIGPQDRVNFKQSQLDAVLAKHGAPKIAIPRSMAGPNGGLNLSDKEAFFVDDMKNMPQYILWNAEIGSAAQERDGAITQFCIAAEFSPMLLGIDRGGAPESARKYRLNATSSLDKANRKALLRRPLIKRAITVAQMLEQTIVGVRYDVGEISIEFRDGLPVDEHDEAETIALYRGSKSMSRRAAVERRLNNPTAVEAELAELDAEDQRDAGTTLGMFTRTPVNVEPAPDASSDAESNTDRSGIDGRSNDAGTEAING